ncbi:TPA: glycosyltransferase [Klebsiella pneumoniae]
MKLLMKHSISNLPSELIDNPICFFFPSKIVGGHELMAIELMKELYDMGKDINVAFLSQNIELKERIAKRGIDIDYITISLKQPRFEFLHTLFNFSYLSKVNEAILKINSFSRGNIVIVQGDIELGAGYVKKAYENGIFLYSYIPYAHSAKKMSKALAFLRDYYYPFLYKKINKYITISEQFRKELLQYNERSEVYVVENKVRSLDIIKQKRAANSDYKNIKYNIAIIGRVSIKQKGHDILIMALAQLAPEILDKVRLHIVGDGIDLNRVKKLIAVNCNKIDVVYHGWCKEPWEKVYDVDLIVIPSRFEGVPLVMLESLALEIDILASNIDSMIDYLEPDNLFNDVDDLRLKIEERILAVG